MEDIIYALETRLLYQRRDDFDQLLAADFFEIGTSGRTYTKAMQLAAVTDEPRVDIPEISTFRIVRTARLFGKKYTVANVLSSRYTLLKQRFLYNYSFIKI